MSSHPFASLMSDSLPDPIRQAAILISPAHADDLERRLKRDIIDSIGRIKPAVVVDVDFEADVMSGRLFTALPAPLQGIAIARTEGALAFYNRVGWNPLFLHAPLHRCIVDEAHLETLARRYHARHLHDLAYVHPKHFEKLLGKSAAARLWEELKRFALIDRADSN